MRPTLQFYFDYASPYSYLANARLAKELPDVHIQYQPVYLRGFESFKQGMPFTENKLLHMINDCQRSSIIYDVPMRLPSNFPINGLYACRGALVAMAEGYFERYHPHVFAATWNGDVNISDQEALCQCVAELDIDIEKFTRSINSDAIKNALTEATALASKKKFFGVPAFEVNQDIVWGSDRFDHLRYLLSQTNNNISLSGKNSRN